MKYLAGALVITTSLVLAKAVNVNGDPTDLSNYPACAVNALGAALCPNGIDFILSEVEYVLASTQFLIPATPTYPPSITALSQASAVLATATPAPNLGNPTNSQSYPPCVQLCLNQTTTLIRDKNSLVEICGLQYRTQMAVCETAICSNYDRQAGQLLAQQLCNPFYNNNNNASLGSSVSAAIVSATPIARAAASGKNAMDIANYPACAKQQRTNHHHTANLPNLHLLPRMHLPIQHLMPLPLLPGHMAA
ncbi:MAG: hypothetical protein Q9208_006750 [Pyrenodesmia sp. 3 TL-2023]